MNNQDIEFYQEWMDAEDYELKILMLVSLLAENNLAFRGSLKTMCEWMGLRLHADNTKKVKDALRSLEDKEYIYHITEGRIHHISISKKGLSDRRVIKLRKAWIETIKNYRSVIDEYMTKVDWAKVVKVFVFCIQEDGEVKKMTDRAESVGISVDTFRRSLAILKQLEFDGLVLEVNTKKRYIDNKYWITLGTAIDTMRPFEEESEEEQTFANYYWPDEDEYEILS